jgi:hypothetical protein
VGKRTNIKWLSEPQKRDYTAGESYLSLTFEHQAAKNVAEELERAETWEFAAKDIFRASGLSLLGISNSHGEKYRTRIIMKKNIPPFAGQGQNQWQGDYRRRLSPPMRGLYI